MQLHNAVGESGCELDTPPTVAKRIVYEIAHGLLEPPRVGQQAQVGGCGYRELRPLVSRPPRKALAHPP